MWSDHLWMWSCTRVDRFRSSEHDGEFCPELMRQKERFCTLFSFQCNSLISIGETFISQHPGERTEESVCVCVFERRHMMSISTSGVGRSAPMWFQRRCDRVFVHVSFMFPPANGGRLVLRGRCVNEKSLRRMWLKRCTNKQRSQRTLCSRGCMMIPCRCSSPSSRSRSPLRTC